MPPLPPHGVFDVRFVGYDLDNCIDQGLKLYRRAMMLFVGLLLILAVA